MHAPGADEPDEGLLREADIAREKLAVIAVESGMAFAELVGLWSQDTEAQLAAAGAALDAGDLREVARFAHSASGASASCGVEGLGRLLKRVESLAAEGNSAGAATALARARGLFARLRDALDETQ